MDYYRLVRSLPKSMIEEFERVTETGYWRNGMPMTSQQIATCREVLAINRAEHDAGNQIKDDRTNPASATDQAFAEKLNPNQRLLASFHSGYLH